jgi:hypothetical protein
MLYLLAQTANPQDIITNQQQNAQALQLTIGKTFTDLLSSPLFQRSSTVGAVLVVMSIGWYGLGSIQRHARSEDVDMTGLVKSILVGLLVVLLIGSPGSRGSLLSQAILGANAAMNGASNFILNGLSNDLGGGNVVSEAVARTTVNNIRSEGFKKCATENPEVQDDCFVGVLDQIKEYLAPFQRNQWATDLFIDSQNRVGEALKDKGSYGSSKFFERLFGGLGSTAGGVVGLSLTPILFVMGTVFVWIIEHVKIVTALIAPLFLGLSLLPPTSSMFVDWAKGFFSLGLVQIIYNLMIGVVAFSTVNAPQSDPLIFPLVVAVLSIVLSIAAIGGGAFALIRAGAGGAALLIAARR